MSIQKAVKTCGWMTKHAYYILLALDLFLGAIGTLGETSDPCDGAVGSSTSQADVLKVLYLDASYQARN